MIGPYFSESVAQALAIGVFRVEIKDIAVDGVYFGILQEKFPDRNADQNSPS